MRRIAIVIKDAYSYAGTENICNFMTECFSGGNSIDIYSFEGDGETFYPYTNVQRIYSFSNKKLKYLSIVSSLKKNNYDYIFLISMGKLSVFFPFYSFLFKLKKGVKIISCEHVSLSSYKPYLRGLKYVFLKYYDRVIVLTDSDRVRLKNKGCHVLKIPNPIFPKARVGEGNGKRALAIGRLEYQKGFDLLIDIWSEFKKNDSSDGWVLNIAGDGSLKDYLINKIKENGVSDSIFLLGRINNVDELYSTSDLFLMTSRYEGLPLVLLEAKSWGLPLVAFDCPTGPKEIITEGIDGHLIPMNNVSSYVKTLTKITHDQKSLSSLKSNAFYGIENYEPGKIKDIWLSLLK